MINWFSFSEDALEPPTDDPDDDESRIIARLLRQAPRRRRGLPLAVGPGDDAAVLSNGRAWTLDTLVEGVHFDGRLSPADVGWKAVAVSVSDLAAMGAMPTDLLLGLSVSQDGDDVFVDGLAQGVADACQRFEVDLIGGDTTRSSGARVVTSAMGGQCVAAPLRRNGAQPQDDIWVTGTLGGAGRGWALPEPTEDDLRALRRPDPPLAFALALARSGLARAAMDLSDGLAADLPRLCTASGVGARIDAESLPGSADLLHQVRGGEDYQLLFTASPSHREKLGELGERLNTQLTRIGVTTPELGARLAGRPWPDRLFQHFRPAQ